MKAKNVRKVLRMMNEFMCTNDYFGAYADLSELERLADIGRATEKAFNNGLHLHSKVKELHGDTSDIEVILNTYELLEWAKGGK